MDRRTFVSTLTIALLAAPLAAEAQPTTKIGRIALVLPGAGRSPFMEALYIALRDAGYIEGRNIAIDYRLMTRRENEYDRVMGSSSNTWMSFSRLGRLLRLLRNAW